MDQGYQPPGAGRSGREKTSSIYGAARSGANKRDDSVRSVASPRMQVLGNTQDATWDTQPNDSNDARHITQRSDSDTPRKSWRREETRSQFSTPADATSLNAQIPEPPNERSVLSPRQSTTPATRDAGPAPLQDTAALSYQSLPTEFSFGSASISNPGRASPSSRAHGHGSGPAVDSTRGILYLGSSPESINTNYPANSPLTQQPLTFADTARDASAHGTGLPITNTPKPSTGDSPRNPSLETRQQRAAEASRTSQRSLSPYNATGWLPTDLDNIEAVDEPESSARTKEDAPGLLSRGLQDEPNKGMPRPKQQKKPAGKHTESIAPDAVVAYTPASTLPTLTAPEGSKKTLVPNAPVLRKAPPRRGKSPVSPEEKTSISAENVRLLAQSPDSEARPRTTSRWSGEDPAISKYKPLFQVENQPAQNQTEEERLPKYEFAKQRQKLKALQENNKETEKQSSRSLSEQREVQKKLTFLQGQLEQVEMQKDNAIQEKASLRAELDEAYKNINLKLVKEESNHRTIAELQEQQRTEKIALEEEITKLKAARDVVHGQLKKAIRKHAEEKRRTIAELQEQQRTGKIALEEEITKIKTAHDDAHGQLEEMTRKHAELENKLQDLKREEIQKSTNQLNQQEAMIDPHERRAKDEQDEVTQQLEQARAALDGQRALVVERDTTVERLTKEVTTLKRSLKRQQGLASAQQEEIRELKLHKSQASLALSSSEKEIKQKQTEIVELKLQQKLDSESLAQKLERSQAALDEEKKQATLLEQQLTDIRRALQAQIAEAMAQNDELVSAREQGDSMRSQVNRLNRDIELHKATISSLEAQVATEKALQNGHSQSQFALRKELHDWKRKYNEAVANTSYLTALVEEKDITEQRAETEVTQLKGALERAEAEATQLKGMLERTEAEVTKLKAQREDNNMANRAAIDQKVNIERGLREALTRAEAEVIQLKTQHEEKGRASRAAEALAKSQLAEMERQRQVLNEEISTVRNALLQAKNEWGPREGDQTTKTSDANLSAMIEDLSKQFRARIGPLKTEITQIQSELDKTVNQARSLDQALRKTQSSLKAEAIKSGERSKELEKCQRELMQEIAKNAAREGDMGSATTAQKKLEDQAARIADMTLQIKNAQEEIRQVQAANMGTQKKLRNNFLEDSKIRELLEYDVVRPPKKWARDYARPRIAPDFINENSTELLLQLAKILATNTSPASIISKYRPTIFVNALLAQFLAEKVFKQPFLPLGGGPKDGLDQDVDTLYQSFLEVDTAEAHRWRSHTLWLYSLSQTPEASRSTVKDTLNIQPTESIRDSVCTLLAQQFIRGPAAALLVPESVAMEKDLASLIKKATCVSVALWKQRTCLVVRGYGELTSKLYSCSSEEMKAHRIHRLQPEDRSKDGLRVTAVVQPGFVALGNKDGERYATAKVWSKSVVLLE